MRYHGERGRVLVPPRARLARRDVQFELIEPLEGPSIFADHLDGARRRAPSHRQVRRRPRRRRSPRRSPPASRRCRARAASAPRATARSRTSSRPACAMIVELIEAPRVRIEPEFVYPPTAELAASRRRRCASSRSRRSRPAAPATCASPPTTARPASASRPTSAGRPRSPRSCGRSSPISAGAMPSTSSTTGSRSTAR